MRATIIGVFAVVVLVVSVLSLLVMRLSIGDVNNKGEAKRAVTAAVAQLEVEGLRIERWLGEQATSKELGEPFRISATEARGNEATARANGLDELAKNSPVFQTVRPSLIVLFDKKGIVIGRNGSQLMRMENLGEKYPEVVKGVLANRTGSTVWVDRRLLVAYAPISDAEGLVGGVLVGTAFSDERLQNASNATSELGLFAAVKRDGKMEVIARSAEITDAMIDAASGTEKALSSEQVISPIEGLPADLESAARKLSGYGSNQAVIASVTATKSVGGFRSLLFPFLGVFLLGLVLTAVSAHLINNYMSQPISDLEDGLMAVINGQTDIRFELEHKMLGGLVYQVNSLLNQLLDVQEDDTDADGRPSVAPVSTRFSAAINVDERMVALSLEDIDGGITLRDEAPADYYKRIYDEFLAAKRQGGDTVEDLKFAAFQKRIRTDEQSLTSQHGKPFRFRVETKGGDVVLVAIPMA